MPHRDLAARREADRERQRLRARARAEAGLCVRCGREAPVEGGSACRTCRGKRRAADRRRAERRRAAGIKRVRDPKTRQAEYARARQLALERKAAGRCVKCGGADAEPGLTLCLTCVRRRRAGERARYHEAKAAGLGYGGKSVRAKRSSARIRSRQRRQARLDAHVCVRCGRRPPVDGGASCEPCREARRAAERATYHARRSAGRCVRCNAPTFGGEALCGPCTVIETRRQPARNAAARRRYLDRRARHVCTHCGRAPSFGASRCDRCAAKAYARSEHVRGLPVFGAEFTVVHAATGKALGVFEDWEDAVLCLAFAGLEFEEVDVLTEHAPMRPVLTGFS